MGYTPQRTVYVLGFGERHGGLEVQACSAPLGQFLDLVGLADASEDDMDPKVITDLMAGFAEVLVAWNILDPDGAALPADLAGLRTLEFGFVLELVNAWIGAIGTVAGPLDPPSNAGSPSAAPPLPMEPLSPAPAG